MSATYTYGGRVYHATDSIAIREDGTKGVLMLAEDGHSMVRYEDGWRWFPESQIPWLEPDFEQGDRECQ